MKKTIIIILLTCFCCSQVYAAPAITTAPQTIEHKKDVIISGAGFGTKSSAAPLVWDDLEDGIDPRWTAHTGYSINSDNNRYSLSTQNVVGDFSQSKPITFAKDDVASTKWYAYYWFKFGPDFIWYEGSVAQTPVSNLKIFRLWNHIWVVDGKYQNYCNAYVAYLTWYRPGGALFTVENGQGGKYFGFDPIREITIDQWHLQELEFEESSDVNKADGKVKYWFDSKLRFNSLSLVTATTEYPQRGKNFLNVGGFEHYWGTPNESMHLYSDDIYVDNTWARVMLGDNPIFLSCTHREIQIPKAWSNTSITFTSNQGSFADGDTAYLYVVDENGNVNEQGYPVTFGSGGLLGDVDGNGKVDIKDLILVAKDFGKVSGFNLGCDLNGDARVDIKDLIIVAKNFGRSL